MTEVRCCGLLIRLGPDRPETPGAFDGAALAEADPMVWAEADTVDRENESDGYGASLAALQRLIVAHAAAGHRRVVSRLRRRRRDRP
jgi:hypothetical protein